MGDATRRSNENRSMMIRAELHDLSAAARLSCGRPLFVCSEHSRTNSRWLNCELDAGKLLDFPVMADMRDPVTIRLHKAKLRADLLRPARAEDLTDDHDSAGRSRALHNVAVHS